MRNNHWFPIKKKKQIDIIPTLAHPVFHTWWTIINGVWFFIVFYHTSWTLQFISIDSRVQSLLICSYICLISKKYYKIFVYIIYCLLFIRISKCSLLQETQHRRSRWSPVLRGPTANSPRARPQRAWRHAPKKAEKQMGRGQGYGFLHWIYVKSCGFMWIYLDLCGFTFTLKSNYD